MLYGYMKHNVTCETLMTTASLYLPVSSEDLFFSLVQVHLLLLSSVSLED